MAARTLAEHGAPAATLQALRACLDEGRALLEAATPSGQISDPMGWAAMNARFHQALVQGAGNPALASALAHVAKTPMAAAGALGFSGVQPALELAFLARAQSDHADIVAAIEAREGARAEALLREHARRSRDNKRKLLQAQTL
jgi:GntR family transcriptional regulator of vanillate catabolism